MAVQTAGMAGWTLTGDGTAAITAVPDTPVPGTPLTTALTAANPEAPDKAVTVPITVMPVGGVFNRSGAAGEYTVEYVDQNGAVRVQPAAGGPKWYYLPDEDLRKLFTAVYSPNAPGTVDNVEQGAAAVPYTEEISRKVLNLFTIIVGPAPSDDRITIKGTDLPAGTDRYHPVVIDAGIPGEDNSGLPTFIIPAGELGAAGKDYVHIRLRANRGVYLVIEADNNYLVKGNLTNGTAEVVGGGRLRNGAYKGSPLGENAVTLVRLGSFFATGPEKSFDPLNPGYNAAIDDFYSGWLIGPASGNPRIQWGVGDQNGDYFEIRSEGIAFSADITVKKTLILDSSLWFINGPTLTIDAAGDSLLYEGEKGLITANGDYRFYGTKTQSGGQNIADVMAQIIIHPGSSIHRASVDPEHELYGDKFVTAVDGISTITNQGDVKDDANPGDTKKVSYTADDSRHGYFNWVVPRKDI
jgi:hypothetical protein